MEIWKIEFKQSLSLESFFKFQKKVKFNSIFDDE
jgi:hypothetical protein